MGRKTDTIYNQIRNEKFALSHTNLIEMCSYRSVNWYVIIVVNNCMLLVRHQTLAIIYWKDGKDACRQTLLSQFLKIWFRYHWGNKEGKYFMDFFHPSPNDHAYKIQSSYIKHNSSWLISNLFNFWKRINTEIKMAMGKLFHCTQGTRG